MIARWPVVLFDFDGTLADTVRLIVASYHHAIAAAGLPPATDAEVRSWIGQPLRSAFERRHPGRGAELTERYRVWNLAHHDELIATIDGVPALLDDLTAAGVATGVVSSKPADTVRLGLRATGLDDRIAVLAGLGDTAQHKPHPDPLLLAATKLEATPADCVYVGDADVDVLAAQTAGMAAVAVTWGAGEAATLQALEPDALVDDVAGLRAMLLPLRT